MKQAPVPKIYLDAKEKWHAWNAGGDKEEEEEQEEEDVEEQ